MDDNQKLSYQWSIIEHISTWIQAADNKAVALLAISSVILGFLLTATFDATTSSPNIPLIQLVDGLSVFVLIGGILSLLLSLISSLLCLIGRTESNRKIARGSFRRPDHTLLFFGRIAQYDRDEYVEAMNSTSMEEFGSDLASQIHVLSQLAIEKYRWLNRALIWLIVSIFLFLLLGMTVFF